MRPFRKVILAGMFTLWSLAWDIGNPWLTAAFTVAGILIGVLLYRKRKRSNPAEKAAPGKLPHPIPFGEKPENQFHPIRAERLERELARFAIELFSYRKLSDSLLVGCLIVPAGLLSLFFMEQLLRSKNGLPFLTAAGTVWTVFALLTALSERSRERRQERLLRVAAEEGTRLAAADHRPPFSSDREEDLIRFCRCFGSEAEARTACEFAKQAGFRFLALPQDSLLLAAGESGFRKYVELCEALGFESSDFSPSIGEAVLYLNNHRRIAERRTPVPEKLPPAESRPAPPPSAAVRKLRELARSGNVSNVSTVYEEESVRRPLFSEALFCGCWPSREEAAIAMVIRDTAAEVTCRGHSMMCYPEDPVALLVNGEFDSMDDVEFILTLELRFSIRIPDGDAEKLLNGTLAELVAEIRRRQSISQPARETISCSTNSSAPKAALKS